MHHLSERKGKKVLLIILVRERMFWGPSRNWLCREIWLTYLKHWKSCQVFHRRIWNKTCYMTPIVLQRRHSHWDGKDSKAMISWGKRRNIFTSIVLIKQPQNSFLVAQRKALVIFLVAVGCTNKLTKDNNHSFPPRYMAVFRPTQIRRPCRSLVPTYALRVLH